MSIKTTMQDLKKVGGLLPPNSPFDMLIRDNENGVVKKVDYTKCTGIVSGNEDSIGSGYVVNLVRFKINTNDYGGTTYYIIKPFSLTLLATSSGSPYYFTNSRFLFSGKVSNQLSVNTDGSLYIERLASGLLSICYKIDSNYLYVALCATGPVTISNIKFFVRISGLGTEDELYYEKVSYSSGYTSFDASKSNVGDSQNPIYWSSDGPLVSEYSTNLIVGTTLPGKDNANTGKIYLITDDN